MPREIHFNGRKPSKAQVMKHVRGLVKDGWTDIHVIWGENRIEIENIHGDWYGSGWIRDISGQDIARFDLNERRAA
jgi:hypothetical protein